MLPVLVDLVSGLEHFNCHYVNYHYVNSGLENSEAFEEPFFSMSDSNVPETSKDNETSDSEREWLKHKTVFGPYEGPLRTDCNRGR